MEAGRRSVMEIKDATKRKARGERRSRRGGVGRNWTWRKRCLLSDRVEAAIWVRHNVQPVLFHLK
jgi:hypothetical protein